MSEQKAEAAEVAGAKEHEVQVHVKSLITGESVHFKMAESSTVQATWDEAYVKLEEDRRPGDTFRCADGTDLMGRLGETLEQLRADHVCEGDHFEIRGPSGGAS
jgi:hypothetical protein